MSVNEEMNSVGSRIPSRWKRTTVADGDWLQKYTLDPLSARDEFLASKIQESIDGLAAESAARIEADNFISGEFDDLYKDFTSFSANTSANIDYLSGCIDDINDNIESMSSTIDNKIENLQEQIDTEIEERTEADTDLQKQIDTLKAATDVIDVWGTYDSFSSYSATKYFPAGEAPLITNNDIIKILNDEVSSPVNHQSYWQCTFPEHQDPTSSNCTWNFIGYVDPYYNTAEIDEKFDGISSTISNNYLSAKGAVLTGRNIVITEDPNNPKITISTKDEVDFDSVSASTAYGSSAKFTNISSTSLTALTANGNSAKFDNISAKTLTALTATGTSAKFTNVSSTNLSSTNISATNLSATNASGTSAIYNNISSTNLTALTATGNSAEFGYFSGTNIRGGTNTATIDALIGSAQSGKDAYDKVSTAYWSAYKDSTHSGSGKLSANFSISAGENLDMEISNNIIKLNGKPAGVIHDDNLSGLGVQGDLLGLNSAVQIYVPFIANQNRNSAIVEVGNTPVPYNMGTYNEGFAVYRNHTFNVGASTKTADLGTTVGFTGMTVTHSANGIGGFNEDSKYGEVFDLNYNCGDSYLKHLWVNEDGLNFTDLGNLSYSATLNYVNLKFYDNQHNIPGTNTKYLSQYVNASSIYKWNNTSDIVTGQSATLYPGSGINFYDAGSNRLGIAVNYSTATEDSTTYVTALNNIPLSAGMKYQNGDYIEVNNSTKKINLSSNIVIEYMSAASAIFSADYTGGTYYNYITPSSTRFAFGFGSTTLSQTGVAIANNYTTVNIPWSKLTNDFVLTTGNASGSKLSASTAVTLVVTSRLPNVLEDDTYYIV